MRRPKQILRCQRRTRLLSTQPTKYPGGDDLEEIGPHRLKDHITRHVSSSGTAKVAPVRYPRGVDYTDTSPELLSCKSAALEPYLLQILNLPVRPRLSEIDGSAMLAFPLSRSAKRQVAREVKLTYCPCQEMREDRGSGGDVN